MKRKTGNAHRLVIFLFAFFAVLLLVSMVTAVPYTESQHNNNQFQALEKIMGSKSYQKLKRITEKHFNDSQAGYIRGNIEICLSKIMSDTNATFPLLVEMLLVVAEIILLVFGHNPVGYGITMLSCSVVAFIVLVFVDGAVGAITALFIPVMIYKNIISSDTFLYQYGVVGYTLATLALILVSWIIVIVGAPILMILDFLVDFQNTMEAVYQQLGETI